MFKDFVTLIRGARPVYLFAFMRQAVTWRYASADRDITIGGNTYTRATISRSEIKQTIEPAQDKITIEFAYARNPNARELPTTQPLGDNWHPFVPSDPVTVICMAYDAGDADQEVITEWTGRVQQPQFEDGKLTLTCVPSSSILNSLHRGPKWGVQDWKIPYAPVPRGMGLKREDYEFAATITAISGLQVTASEFAGSTYNLAGGELSWTRSSGIIERAMILAHSGDTVTLLTSGPELAVGLAVTALPTCGHAWADFAARGITDEYGGSLYMPKDDPYGNESMSWSA